MTRLWVLVYCSGFCLVPGNRSLYAISFVPFGLKSTRNSCCSGCCSQFYTATLTVPHELLLLVLYNCFICVPGSSLRNGKICRFTENFIVSFSCYSQNRSSALVAFTLMFYCCWKNTVLQHFDNSFLSFSMSRLQNWKIAWHTKRYRKYSLHMQLFPRIRVAFPEEKAKTDKSIFTIIRMFWCLK